MGFRATTALSVLMIALNTSAWSQDIDTGRTGFLSNCAECHGADGKGNGPLSAKMKTRPADLTIIAKRNNGMFSSDAVYKMIDGRETTAFHRRIEMPIWGCRHLSRPVPQSSVTLDPLESLLDLPCDPEPVIRRRILAIVEYLRLIQEK